MQLIDPGDAATWPADVAAAISELAERCRGVEANERGIPSHELRLEEVDTAYEVEVEFRMLLGIRPVALLHATRLLPHEVADIRTTGLHILDADHRSRRLDAVLEHYGDKLGRDALEALRNAGPLSWDQGHRDGRLGLLWG